MRRLLPHLLRETDVGLIRTAAPNVVTTTESEPVEEALARCDSPHDFDMLPVLRNGEVVGTFWPEDVTEAEGKTVGQAMRPPRDHAVARSTQISDLFPLLAQKKVLVVTGDGGMVLDGVVSYADLNRRPVRVLVYAFLSELEGKLGESLRSAEGDPDRFLKQYGKFLNESTLGRWMKARLSGVGIHPIENSSLSDLARILSEVEGHRSKLGFQTKGEATRAFSPLAEMRNKVMHPVRLLVRSLDDAKKLDECFNKLTHLLERIDQRTNLVPRESEPLSD